MTEGRVLAVAQIIQNVVAATGRPIPTETAVQIVITLEDAGYRIVPPMVSVEAPPLKRRLRTCVEEWPECEEGAYHPRCCRFPKSCSCTIYSDEHVTEDDLEPLSAPASRPSG